MQKKIIFGPPGTGKTHYLLDLLAKELADGTPANKIAFVTFTREGAYQGVRRAKEQHPKLTNKDFMYFRTVHSMCFQALKLKRSNVMQRGDYRTFGRKLGFDFMGYFTEDCLGTDDRYLFFDEVHRNNPRKALDYIHELDHEKLAYIRLNFMQYKKIFAKMDYTDMLSAFVNKGENVPVEVAFIDEAQDLTRLQWQAVWLAFRNCKRVYIAGDDDQAIYQWSGADVEQLLRIEGDIEVLRHSYRLPDNILYFAKRITSQMARRAPKEYSGRGRDGLIEKVNSFAEVPIHPGRTYLFLSRNRAFLPEIVQWLREAGHAYTFNAVGSVSADYVQLIEEYEHHRKYPGKAMSPTSQLRYHLRDGYSLSEPWYDSFDWDPDTISYYRALAQTRSLKSDIKIRVATIHSVKGAEADVVVLLTNVTRRVAKNFERCPDEEHRVFYVAATRAKQALYVVCPSSKFYYPILEF